ncbi:Fic family protein [Elusimicrobiota bacterium]
MMFLGRITRAERQRLVSLFFRIKSIAERLPKAREEAVIGLRCLKAVNSNVLEGVKIDRVFLQILLHNAGLLDKGDISPVYRKAWLEIQGHQMMLRHVEAMALKQKELSVSAMLEMHRIIFEKSWPDMAGKLRTVEVQISAASHLPAHPSQVAPMLQQYFADLNSALSQTGDLTEKNFFDVLSLSARTQYRIAHIHPFIDGNGRIARAAGDYVMLCCGMLYVIVKPEYRDAYLAALEESSVVDCSALTDFLVFNYLETMERLASFFYFAEKNADDRAKF